MTKARSAPRLTARVWCTIASRVTGQRRLEAEDHRAERVADEERVDSGAIEQPRHRRVVSGQHHDLLARRFIVLKSGTRMRVLSIDPPCHSPVLAGVSTDCRAKRANLLVGQSPPSGHLQQVPGSGFVKPRHTWVRVPERAHMRGDGGGIPANDRAGQGGLRSAVYRVADAGSCKRCDRPQRHVRLDSGQAKERDRGIERSRQGIARHHRARMVIA